MTLDLTQGVTRAQLAEHVLGSAFGSAKDYLSDGLFDRPCVPAGITLIAMGVIFLGIAGFVAYLAAGGSCAGDKVIVGLGSSAPGLFGLGLIVGLACYVAFLYLKKMSQEKAIEWLKDMRQQLSDANEYEKSFSSFNPNPSEQEKWNQNYQERLLKIDAFLNKPGINNSINNS